jgi:hypothetical protein
VIVRFFLDNYDAEIRGTLPNVTVNGGVMFTFCCSNGQQYSNNSESPLYDVKEMSSLK